MLKRKKICLIFCGGTTISYKDPRGTSVFKKEDISNWLKLVPEISLIGEIDSFFFYGGSSSDITVNHWVELANEIKKRLDKYDGFVITHGLDTILYTSSILSYMLQDLSKPIVFTGSQIPSKKEKPEKSVLDSLFKK